MYARLSKYDHESLFKQMAIIIWTQKKLVVPMWHWNNTIAIPSTLNSTSQIPHYHFPIFQYSNKYTYTYLFICLNNDVIPCQTIYIPTYFFIFIFRSGLVVCQPIFNHWDYTLGFWCLFHSCFSWYLLPFS